MNAPDPTALPLRDIHLPGAIGAWPPAPGWWVLLALAMVVLIMLAILLVRRRRYQVQREAANELADILKNFSQNQNERMAIRGISQLLRRVSITLDPGSAAHTGDTWFDTLSALGQEHVPDDIKQALTTLPYSHPDDGAGGNETLPRLSAFVSSWIKGTQKTARADA
tara:strand:+ start:204 stop:704 length:501 start_codon:yes stop_codon:yes gene_type:complete